MIRKVTAVNGNLSDLINALNEVLKDCGDMEVTVCGVRPINIYHADGMNAIVLDDDSNLEG